MSVRERSTHVHYLGTFLGSYLTVAVPLSVFFNALLRSYCSRKHYQQSFRERNYQ